MMKNKNKHSGNLAHEEFSYLNHKKDTASRNEFVSIDQESKYTAVQFDATKYLQTDQL